MCSLGATPHKRSRTERPFSDEGGEARTAPSPFSGHPIGYRLSVSAGCSFAPDLSSVQTARRFVERELQGSGIDDDTLFRVQVLTTELVSNAVRHAGTSVDVTVTSRGDRIRVGARDYSTTRPVPPPVDTPTRHRGLLLVEDLADDWGVDIEDDSNSKVVWFEVVAA